MIMKLNINDRAALAIKNKTKRVEIRANKENSELDYSKLKENDIIEFTSNNLGIFYVKVKEVNYYETLEELFTLEGTRYTTSSTNDKEEAIKNVSKLDGYEEAIKKNGEMQIIEYENKYLEDVKDLLVELEEYIVSIDKDNLDQVHPEYRKKWQF